MRIKMMWIWRSGTQEPELAVAASGDDRGDYFDQQVSVIREDEDYADESIISLNVGDDRIVGSMKKKDVEAKV